MLSNELKSELRGIVGADRYLDEKEDLLIYSYDAFMVKGQPDVVLFPVTTEEVSKIMKVATREKIPVTPRGAATNLTGGSVPTRGGIALVFTKMNKILDIDKENRVAVVQPGVVNMDLQKELAKYGLYYPPDPGSMAVTTMGGNVAENAGGPRAVKYGVTKDYLLGMEVVLASGQVLRTGGKTIKNVTGYNLTQLFCGSEGTLGLITEIILKLFPLPEAKRTLQAAYKNLSDAGKTVIKVMEVGILPVALELLDKTFINIIEDYTHLGLPREAEALLLIEVDGPEAGVIEDRDGRRFEIGDRLSADRGRLAQGVGPLAGERGLLCPAQLATGVEQRGQRLGLPIGELIQAPNDGGRLAERLDDSRLGISAGIPEALHQGVTLRDEPRRRHAEHSGSLVGQSVHPTIKACRSRAGDGQAEPAAGVRSSPADRCAIVARCRTRWSPGRRPDSGFSRPSVWWSSAGR